LGLRPDTGGSPHSFEKKLFWLLPLGVVFVIISFGE